MHKITFGIFILLVSLTANAQKFSHQLGGSVSIFSWKEPVFNGMETEDASSSITLTSANYFPRYHIANFKNSSVTVGAPVGVGFGLAKDVFTDEAGFAFAFDIPVVVDFNIGSNANSASESKWGGFAGVGFGYNRVSISGSEYFDFTGASYGPIFRAGAVFRKFALGFNFKPGLEEEKFKTFTLNVFYAIN